MKSATPYDPPGANAGQLSALDWAHTAKVFVGCIIGGSLLAGTVQALRSVHALSTFGAESRAAGIVAVWALRAGGAHLTATAAAVAFVIAIHRRPGSSGLARATIAWAVLLPILLALPVTAPVAACLISAAAFTVAALFLDISFGASWATTVNFVRATDPLVGAIAASLFAAVLGLAAPLLVRILVASRRRLHIKIAAAILATLAINALVGAVMDAASLQEEGPR